ncbi:MAG: replication initiator protein A [Clostridia bacterium]|nr:replication initiator protein A [Clostridia bacterium]
MTFDYFYGTESEQFSFYRIPKVLFRDEHFKNVSTDAKVLYGLMLDRMSLSMKNRWIDEENRVYIIYTITDIMEDLNCADQKAGRMLSELDNIKGVGLIERKRQGLGKPNIIYVKNFMPASQMQNRENHDSGKVIITNQEMRKSRTNNTEYNNTELNETENISYPIESEVNRPCDEAPDAIRWMEERTLYERIIKKNIEYEISCEKFGRKWVDEIVMLMVDVVCCRGPCIRINRQEYPQAVVKTRFLKIDSEHIEYIFFALQNNTSEVRNIRAFLITTIYRAFETSDNWFAAKANFDLKHRKEAEHE